MSACDSDAATVTHDVSALIQARLDAFVDCDHDSEVLSAELAAICGKYPEAPWEVLALIDQYHRRGRLTTEIYQAVKSDTHRLIFGRTQADETPRFPMAPETDEEEQEPDSMPRPASGDGRSGPVLDGPDSTPIDRAAAETVPAAPPVPATVRHRADPPPMPRAATAPPPVAQDSSPVPVAPGTVLCERYVIEAPLGRGGSSAIFRALDRHRLNLPPEDRRVAVKILRDEFSADRGAVLALQEEFCLAQSLSHPNIVNVFDLGRDGDRYFMTMELLEGEKLGVMMRRMHPELLPLADAFWIIHEIGSALQYAHERGIVHADLSPANILLTRAGRVCLLDFGIAIRTRPGDPSSGPAPQSSSPAATLRRMGGRRGPASVRDARDDIHDLACIAYELLSGRRPFGDSASRAVRPTAKRPRRIRALTARQWRALRWALAADRERRPQTVREWLDRFRLQRAQNDSRPRSAAAGGREPRPATWLAGGMAVIAGALALLSTSETDPLRNIPMVVAARRIASEILETSAGPVPGSDTSAAELAPSPVAPERAGATENAFTETIVADAGIAAVASKAARARDGATVAAMHGPGVLYFDRQSYRVGEGGMAARLTVRRVAGSDGEVAFQWRTIASSARSGDDFASFDSETERLGPGQETAIIYVPIVSDTLAEDTEQFEVEIDRPGGGASLGPVTRATVIIEDDD